MSAEIFKVQREMVDVNGFKALVNFVADVNNIKPTAPLVFAL